MHKQRLSRPARETQSESDAGYGDVLEKSVAKMASDEQNGRSPDSVARVALALAARKPANKNQVLIWIC